MRPTVGQILSGLALGAVAASMLVMPERFLGTENAAVPGLVLQAPAEHLVVRAAPIRPQRAPRSIPAKRRVIVVARHAPFTVAISRRIPVRPSAEPPPPVPARKDVTEPPVVARPPPPPPPPPPPESAVPSPPSPPPAIVAGVSQKKDKAKDDKPRKEKKHKKWRDDEDDDRGGQDRRHRDKDHDDDD
jgi:hypothetical protein